MLEKINIYRFQFANYFLDLFVIIVFKKLVTFPVLLSWQRASSVDDGLLGRWHPVVAHRQGETFGMGCSIQEMGHYPLIHPIFLSSPDHNLKPDITDC